ncbi:MAG: glycosyltransferase, partial [Alphaproteobacteria bacterium]|nr:glycosyltransferase [Alphaproteobacteria bacterium]
HKDNKGLAVRLNEVLAIAQAPYIARMDGDDVADLKRFSKQVAFLDNHPDIGVCGTGFEVLPSGKKLRMPLKHKRIVERLLFTTGVCHPTVMMRREVLEKTGGYPVVPCAQDYALWVNLVSKGVKFANLQDNLLQYRVHKSSTTAQKKQKKRLVHAQVQGKVLEGLLKRKPTELELELHHKLSVREPDFGSIWQMFKWVLVLLQKGPFWLVLKNFVLWFIVSLRRRSA